MDALTPELLHTLINSANAGDGVLTVVHEGKEQSFDFKHMTTQQQMEKAVEVCKAIGEATAPEGMQVEAMYGNVKQFKKYNGKRAGSVAAAAEPPAEPPAAPPGAEAALREREMAQYGKALAGMADRDRDGLEAVFEEMLNSEPSGPNKESMRRSLYQLSSMDTEELKSALAESVEGAYETRDWVDSVAAAAAHMLKDDAVITDKVMVRPPTGEEYVALNGARRNHVASGTASEFRLWLSNLSTGEDVPVHLVVPEGMVCPEAAPAGRRSWVDMPENAQANEAKRLAGAARNANVDPADLVGVDPEIAKQIARDTAAGRVTSVAVPAGTSHEEMVRIAKRHCPPGHVPTALCQTNLPLGNVAVDQGAAAVTATAAAAAACAFPPNRPRQLHCRRGRGGSCARQVGGGAAGRRPLRAQAGGLRGAQRREKGEAAPVCARHREAAAP